MPHENSQLHSNAVVCVCLQSWNFSVGMTGLLLGAERHMDCCTVELSISAGQLTSGILTQRGVLSFSLAMLQLPHQAFAARGLHWGIASFPPTQPHSQCHTYPPSHWATVMPLFSSHSTMCLFTHSSRGVRSTLCFSAATRPYTSYSCLCPSINALRTSWAMAVYSCPGNSCCS